MIMTNDRKLDKMAAKVNTLDPVTSVARGKEWDSQTVHSWLAANTRSRCIEKFKHYQSMSPQVPVCP